MDDLTPAERIADNIINGNISDAKRALRACPKHTAFEAVEALAERDPGFGHGGAVRQIIRLLP